MNSIICHLDLDQIKKIKLNKVHSRFELFSVACLSGKLKYKMMV